MAMPLIGLTGSMDEQETALSVRMKYMNALLQCGAIPVLLSPGMDETRISTLLRTLSGILLSGGGDIRPACYGENTLPETYEVSDTRDRLELMLVKEACGLHLPVFGICRGIQSINVAMGGTLWQDIPTQCPSSLKHERHLVSEYDPTHTVSVASGSRLYAAAGCSLLEVNSFHHQAVKSCAPGFHVTAKAEDGVIESIEADDPTWFCVGVQWHPERMTDTDPAARALFQAFVDACSQLDWQG